MDNAMSCAGVDQTVNVEQCLYYDSKDNTAQCTHYGK